MVFNIRLAVRLLSRTSRSTFSCKTCASMGTCQMQKKLAWHKFWLLLYLFLFFYYSLVFPIFLYLREGSKNTWNSTNTLRARKQKMFIFLPILVHAINLLKSICFFRSQLRDLQLTQSYTLLIIIVPYRHSIGKCFFFHRHLSIKSKALLSTKFHSTF